MRSVTNNPDYAKLSWLSGEPRVLKFLSVKLRSITIFLVSLSLVTPLTSLRVHSAYLLVHPESLSQKSSEDVVKAFGELPLAFELNQGQLHSDVRFLSRSAGSDIYLTSRETILSLRKPGALPKGAMSARTNYSTGKKNLFDQQLERAVTTTHDVVKMRLVGANGATPAGKDELPGTVNYLIGKDPKKWRTNIRTFSRVEYKNVYPGIDQVFYGVHQQLEYDFVVSPGANPRVIKLAFNGVERLHIDQGDLVLQIKGSEEVRFKKPYVYQEVNKVKKQILARYVITRNQVGFEMGDYEASKPLIIDPVLSYSTYLGGSGNDSGFDVAVDAAGNAYVTGSTDSPEFSSLGSTNAFVAKLNATGTERTYLAILGGAGDDTGFSIAVDPGGSAYITGTTDSVDFPVTNAIQSNFGGGSQDAFVAKLNQSGSALTYATFFGGSGSDTGFSLAVDLAGGTYITGSTDSSEFSSLGNTDVFVAKLNPAGDERAYLSILGGSSDDTGFDIAVDGSGSAYVVGSTDSENFTTANALQPNFGGSQDAFLAKLNPTGSGVSYSTYLGGSGSDSGFGLAVDGAGNAYVIGSTDSTEFSTLGGRDVFVAKFSATGDQRTYFTILGGSGDDAGFAIAVDAAGGAYLTGSTDSSNFTTANALQPTSGGSQDVFIAKLSPSGSTLDYSTFVGNISNESGFAIAVDNSGSAYVSGFTSSPNFPTASSLQSVIGGSGDAFLLRIPGSAVPTWQATVLATSQADVKTWSAGGRTYAYLKLSFPNAGYRVTNWGAVINAGTDFTADAAVERFNGTSVQAETSNAQIYDLGALAEGTYKFNFKASGTLAKSVQFIVSSVVPPPNSIDVAREFVKQQYRDFLNREADQAGEDFWTDNITKCNDPARRPAGQTEAQCTIRQRETTSAAFFLSPEFQYTSYYVYRMYQGALGRQPKLSEFTPDAQFVGNGIVVNGQLSGPKINQNKADFAQQFVNCTDSAKYRCAEFKAIYDGLNNQQYVDKLFQMTGVNASASDRADLVNAIGATETRASVLQKVVDGIVVISEGNQQFTTTYGQAFYNSEFNRAFVQLEYFGYMKRDPDEAGYGFWLGKLNQFGGNFVNAEMVLAFISSPEYRARFGQP